MTFINFLFAYVILSICPSVNKNNFFENSIVNPGKEDFLWMQKILNNWDFVCKNELKIKAEPLPWIIFYDSSTAWHLNADERVLPQFIKTTHHLLFSGQNYPLNKIPHSKEVWVPERKSISIDTYPTVTMPYSNNKKAFFIAPLPSFFHKLATPDQADYLDFLFIGNYIHELTHTRQLRFALPQLLNIQKAYKLPESIDDNTIENTFGKNEVYKSIFFEEKTHLWNALFAPNKDSCFNEIEKALIRTKQRKSLFFTGDSLGYNELEDIFISLEGSAMWAQYRIMVKSAPKDLSEQQTLFWLLQRSPSWAQEEGLALFLLLEKLSPDWKKQFFETELPSAFTTLNGIVSNNKKEKQ